MKKDIEIPVAKEVHIVIIREWNDEFLSKDWNAYLINNRNDAIEMAIVVSKGFDGDIKTSTMRHGIGYLEPKTFRKVELIQEDVLALNNEFFVTFFAENKLFEKRFLFPKHTITEEKLTNIPIMGQEGILSEY
ncbi:hypothetical protein [Flagellimonas pelagia]|uniref:Phenylalanyl-tRNA synthetase subunit alpha n=1 Tax=Flagellimonas pelagia TaxID=2306998 RepID=A0A3A1NIM8_9FLAO|nr:hypothetical protein [Allomuricauda maritima]RIV43933.1 hypothetical protein D2V05_10555 [Allomuricauda maritima]TXJ93838.1 hypothetical protein FQ017_10445 [Allomuricauda maritima]